MKKMACAIGILGALSAYAGTASAQDEFATQGTFSFGVERVFGFYLTKRELDRSPGPGGGPDEISNDFTTFSLAYAGQPPSPYAVPRVGVDYFVIDGLSIGGGIGFASYHQEDEFDGVPDEDEIDSTTFLISPRVGYAVMFSDVIGIWPRGGFTFYTQSNEVGPADFDENAFALTLEFHLVIVPVDHVGLTVGPVIDLGLFGEREDPGDPDYDLNQHSFGFIAAGMFGFL